METNTKSDFSTKPLESKEQTASEKKLIRGSFIVSLFVHGLILLTLGSIVIDAGTGQRTQAPLPVVPPMVDVPEPPKMDEGPSDTAKTHTGASTPTDVLEFDSSSKNIGSSDLPMMNSKYSSSPSLSGLLNSSGIFSKKNTLSSETAPDKTEKHTFFNTKKIDNENTLTAYLVDLKQTSLRKSSKMNWGEYLAAIHGYIHSDWAPSFWDKFFIPNKRMYVHQIFVPDMLEDDYLKFFEVGKEVKPSFWIVRYFGNMQTPRSGRFRFVGSTSDILLVRWNKQLVLDASKGSVAGWKRPEQPKVGKYVFNPKDPQVPKSQAKEQFIYGDWNAIEPDHPYPMEVLLGRHSGKNFYCFLMIEWEGFPPEIDSVGRPIFRIFQVNGASPDHIDTTPENAPPTKL